MADDKASGIVSRAAAINEFLYTNCKEGGVGFRTSENGKRTLRFQLSLDRNKI